MEYLRRILLEDLKQQFGLILKDSEDVGTIVGWFQLQSTVIMPNDSITDGKNRWTILKMDIHHILQVPLEFGTEEEEKVVEVD